MPCPFEEAGIAAVFDPPVNSTPSTHKVEVVRVKPEQHPNADKLLVVPVFGYTVCIAIDSWKDVPRDSEGFVLAAYVPPDSIVDATRPEFDFLRERPVFDADGKLLYREVDESITEVRTKAKRLRGVVSYGFLLPAPPGVKEGDDLAQALGVRHYEPELENVPSSKFKMGSSEKAPAPNVYHVKYDVESLQRYYKAFTPGEPVLVTEKLDGSNARYVFHDGTMHCGSREEWKKEFPGLEHLTVEKLLANSKGQLFSRLTEEDAQAIVDRAKARPPKKNLWWYALERCPALAEFCKNHPDHVVYGEVFGRQGKLKYTNNPDEVFFAAFDILYQGRWLDARISRQMLTQAGVPCVPLFNPHDESGEISPVAFNFENLKELAEGPSLWPGARTIREGLVVKPMVERHDHAAGGRVNLKIVSATYLETKR